MWHTKVYKIFDETFFNTSYDTSKRIYAWTYGLFGNGFFTSQYKMIITILNRQTQTKTMNKLMSLKEEIKQLHTN